MRKITDSVFYIGVNDRTTDKFENLWPLPFGVSYNSYLVKGSEKTVLIDTVAENEIHEFIEKVENTAETRQVDYLVVNHMEPDHSGAIRAILRQYPDLKIIGNKTTLAMLKGFFNIPDTSLMEIKDGEELPIGGLTLQFIFTPMVHWPETMMTYVKEEKLIFSGDAFGCFGALNGGLTDEDMNTDIYFDEMYRYYSNIVGKYGRFVQRAMEKTKCLPIEYICSTHGPVWHAQIGKVMDIYDRLSRYQGEDGVTIIYGTMYGNTAKLAEIIAERLSERGVKNIKIHNASKSDMSYMISDAFRYKGLIVGAPTYSMSIFPPVEEFMKAMQVRELKNKVCGFFGSFCWASCTVSKLKEYAAGMNQEVFGAFDMQYSPDKSVIEEAKKLADKIADNL